MTDTTPLRKTSQVARERWQQPHPSFSSGRDPRSSENAMLVLFYGSLEKAARYGWLNAGRTLVDKTYLRILWTARALPGNGLSFDEMAARLDSFIRAELQPQWVQLAQPGATERDIRAIELVETARLQLFGPASDADAASEVLFFLCPQLPVFPCRGIGAGRYAGFHQGCLQQLRALKDQDECPTAGYGQPRERELIDTLLAQSDWWPRRLLVEELRPTFTS
ncbi:hypothetical protein [Marinobacterium aestuariivivens]|uniref:Uncharacterized protein n=1 Tax=Marinobacterium aestuariivivens TaxID=1698799 RepID=A0ABW2A108_9GAMM